MNNKVIYRPHMFLLSEAMEEKKEFNSIQEMKEYLVNEHNNNIVNLKFKITTDDIWLSDYGDDERIGWRDTKIITYAPYNKISNKEGYLWWFGKKEEDIKDKDLSIGVIGFCSCDYNK